MKKILTILLSMLLYSLSFGQAFPFDAVQQDGSTGYDYTYDIYVDDAGNKYIAGKFKTEIDFGNGVILTPVDNYDGFVAKYDQDNNIQWAQAFGGYSADQANSVIADADGNVLVAGVFYDVVVSGTDTLWSYGNWDVVLLKYDANGNLLWAKQGYTENQDSPTDIKVDSQGNYLLVGYYDVNDSLTLPFRFESLEITGNGERDVFVIKMDSDGNPIWGVSAGGADNEYPGKVVLDRNDNMYISGYYYDTTATFGTTELPQADGADIFTAKLNSSGTFDWAVAVGGPGYDKGQAIDFIDPGDEEPGMVLVTGRFEDSIYVGPTNELYESAGDDDIFVLAFTVDNGSFVKGFSFGGIEDDEAKAIAYIPNSDGDFYVAGISRGDIIMPNDTLVNYGYPDMLILRMHQDSLIWAQNYGGSSYDYLNDAVVDNKGNVYFGGNFKSSPAEFAPFSLNSIGGYDLWLGQMHEPYATVNFSCNMSVQISNGNFDPTTDSLFVRGDFQVDAGDVGDWQGKAFMLTDEDNDQIYELQVSLPTDSLGKTYQFKYVMNETWESVDNRTFTLTFPTTWVNEIFFNNDDGAAPTHAITFEVNMNVQADNGNFNAASDTVSLAGSMNGWSVLADIMSDDDGDGVYSITFDLNEGETYEFKYVINSGGWETIPNRSYTVGTTDDTYYAYFDNDSGAVRTTIALSFQCNMELEIAAQRFDPANDTLSVRGSFNGWSDVTMMTPSVTDPNIYEAVWDYDAFTDEEIYYKFAYTTAEGTNWETGDNYTHVITADDITAGYSIIPLRGYNNSTLDNVVNQESVIRFVVDMNGAVDGNGVAFPSIENVVIAGANPPLQWPDGGWPDADSNKVIFMVDDGTHGDDIAGDNVWTMEVTFPIYSPLDIEYKYGANWGGANGGSNDNEGGVGSNHHIILFPEFTYGSAYDTFGTMETKDVETSIRETGEIPTVYDLGQNYPNPFNPSTVIKFSLPESGMVTLKVFNILGQEVVSLVNEVKSAGVYEVTFDASNLTTGMYIYRIQSGDFTATKKMMLIK